MEQRTHKYRLPIPVSALKMKIKIKYSTVFQEQHSTTTYIGNGIGLHIVKEYVTMHHGTITVENHIPQGTIFTITLPVTHNYAVNDENKTRLKSGKKQLMRCPTQQILIKLPY